VLSTDNPGADYRGAYLGNGYLGQRVMQSGLGYTGETAEPAFMAGGYENESLAQLPPLLPLRIQCSGQVWSADPARTKGYHQELRLKEGLLVTRGGWDTGNGQADLELETALLRSQPDVALVRVNITNRAHAPIDLTLDGRALRGAQPGKFGTMPVLHFKGPGTSSFNSYLQVLDRNDLPALQGNLPGFQLLSGQAATLVMVTQVSGGTLKLKDGGTRFAVLDPGLVDRWLAEHKRAWEDLWARDIEIEGDPEAQQVVRACLFHLFASTRPENDRGIPPMGLSANAFSGHVFWDMDSWMLPALLPQHPELARAMLEYRFRTLPGAKENAAAEKLPGASYAWESAATGKETIGGSVFSHGRHVTGDVALALKHYYAATQDRAWLESRAWPILQSTADNWVARAKPDGKGGFMIPKVTTPDELANEVDHSAWTHFVAGANLDFAAETAKTLGQSGNSKWAEVSKGLGFLRDPQSHLILPYEGFTEKSKSKQADVLLLAHPGDLAIPQDELGKMYDYYVPRVIANGPAMTDAIHAIVAARLGRRDESLKRFRDSYQPFVRPPYELFSEKRSKDNLCFMTGASGVVEAVLYGFGGLHLSPDPAQTSRPLLKPALPPGWTALRIKGLQWRGWSWDVELKPNASVTWTQAARPEGV
jgi:trehalose/maltose hydrolase-like predicted phosphorylase